MTDNTQPTSPATPSRSLETTESAANAFLGLLTGKSRNQTPDKAAPAEAAFDDEVEASGETPSDSRAPGDDPDEAETAEGPDEETTDATEDDPQEGDEPKGRMFTVKVDGTEIQVPEDELIKGYSRTADYHRKTEALANERKAFEQHAQAVVVERQQYQQMLGGLLQQLQQPLPAPPVPPDPALRQTDPLEYALQRADYDEAAGLYRQTVQTAQAEYARVMQLQQQSELEGLRDTIRQGFEKLPELIPAWKDPKAFDRDTKAMREYGRKLGYSDSELNQAYDPRAVAALYKAMKYDELVARRPKPNQPLESVVRPTGPVRQQVQRQGDKSARQRLRQTGSVNDAAQVFARMLKD